MLQKPFEHLEHILSFHEAHLTVYLGKFRLAVRPEVLIPEASYYLAVAVKTGNHQKLLECLRALWKGIELSRIHP